MKTPRGWETTANACPFNSGRQASTKDASKGTAVEMLHGQRIDIYVLQAARVDCRHGIAASVDTISIRMDAAVGTEAVVDHVLVECIAACVRLLRKQVKA